MQEDRYIEALPAGYRLDCYKIEGILGQGGFGITYRAQDLREDRRVAIKEYFPGASATRTRGARVCPRSSSAREEFSYGLQRFMKEAETLTRFSHPNIVKVWRLIDTNDTAYIVMSFEEGEPLAKLIERFPGGLPEPEIVRLFRGVVDGLVLVHGTGHLHRDLAPDNIIIRRDHVPVIIDFGAARCSYGQKSRSLEAIIKCGYSPPEQYTLEHSRQGPWTDVYALGAIAYRCIGGFNLPGSLDRQHATTSRQPDPLTPAAIIGRGRYTPGLLNAVDRALLLHWQDRPAAAEAWYGMFAGLPDNATYKMPEPEPRPAKQNFRGFFRALFSGKQGARKPDAAEATAAGGRCWILSGTDSTGAAVRATISEDALRRVHGGLVIGRDKTQSNITIPDHTVSRRHAVLSLDASGLLIEDANSRNGTWVNGALLNPSLKPAPLGNSTRITLGGVSLVVSVGRSSRAAQ
jgi:serine/threonine protein kinase